MSSDREREIQMTIDKSLFTRLTEGKFMHFYILHLWKGRRKTALLQNNGINEKKTGIFF